MSLSYDIIKIKYVKEGYLPNYPYHLISDEEMCDAFFSESNPCFFYDNYPLLDDALSYAYQALVNSIKVQISLLKSSKEDEYELPDWLITYMLGEVISVNSPIADIHDLLVLMNLDNLDDIFTPEASAACLKISDRWLKKLPLSQKAGRVPSMFGEPHVIKSLRLQAANVNV